MQMTKEKQDLTYLSWSVYRNSSGTAGSFLKAYSELGGTKTYYKLSNFDKARGVIGHECVNELIVDRLLTILGIPHLSYQLIHADVSVDGRTHEVYLCASEDFKAKSESKTALDAYKELEALPDESALDFCIRMGWEDYDVTYGGLDIIKSTLGISTASRKFLFSIEIQDSQPEIPFNCSMDFTNLLYCCSNTSHTTASFLFGST